MQIHVVDSQILIDLTATTTTTTTTTTATTTTTTSQIGQTFEIFVDRRHESE